MKNTAAQARPSEDDFTAVLIYPEIFAGMNGKVLRPITDLIGLALHSQKIQHMERIHMRGGKDHIVINQANIRAQPIHRVLKRLFIIMIWIKHISL
jgi:hypothetical protein